MRRARSRAVFEPVDDLDGIAEEWNRLAETAGNVFGSYEWCRAWWAAHGLGRRLACGRIVTRWDD
jgi:hypothetical protein